MTTQKISSQNPRAGHRGRMLRACATAAALVVGGLTLPAAATASDAGVDAARAALPDPGGITHIKMKLQFSAPAPVAAHPLSGRVDAHLPARFSATDEPGYPTSTGEIERWIALEPLRERIAWLNIAPNGTPGSNEQSYADGTLYEWNSQDRVLHEIPLSDAERAEYEDDVLGNEREWMRNAVWGADPIAGIRAMYDGGMLESAGRTTFEGRSVLRLIGSEPGTEQNGSPAGPITYEYLVDPTSFAPVKVSSKTTHRAPDEHGEGGQYFVTAWTFPVYERLPLDDTTRHLLVAGGGR